MKLARGAGRHKFVFALNAAELAQAAEMIANTKITPHSKRPKGVYYNMRLDMYTVHRSIPGRGNRQPFGVFEFDQLIDAARYADMLTLFFWPWRGHSGGAAPSDEFFNFSVARAKQDLENEKAFVQSIEYIKHYLIKFGWIPESPLPTVGAKNRLHTKELLEGKLEEANKRIDTLERRFATLVNNSGAQQMSIAKLQERLNVLEPKNSVKEIVGNSPVEIV